MTNVIKIKKGLDIPLKGEAEKTFAPDFRCEHYAIKPTDFTGVFPKLKVQEGDKVKAGTPLFFNKYQPDIMHTSPVSGTVEAIVRGEKRLLLEIRIKADSDNTYEDFGSADPASLERKDIVEKMLTSGVWPFIRQRPYNIIADPGIEPKAIFISGFNSAPLGPDYDFILHGQGDAFQSGLDVLKKLSKGKVHLSLKKGEKHSGVLTNSKGVDMHYFDGPHPAGNVGIQIHHIDPINKGDIVWTVNVQDVVNIGLLFREGRFNAQRFIALSGSEVKRPMYYRSLIGSSIQAFFKENTVSENVRIISGNVLTGSKISSEGYLGFFDDQVSVIPEGDHYEFMGWAMPGLKKYSVSRSFFSWINHRKKREMHTNLFGGPRAFVVTGEYEKVLPMGILPVHLLKSILVEDIDMMENLGIYEVVEEDMALCEFVCTSKTDVQEILRKGLNMMHKEMS